MKRTFAFDTTTLATTPLLLDSGVYEGRLINAAIASKEGKNHINVVKETKWDKSNRAFVETGEYVVEGSIYYGALLTDKKAIESLQQDEPRVFGGRIRLSFNKETLQMDNNYVLGSWLQALQLHEINFGSEVDFEYDENIEIPEEFVGVNDIVDKLNCVEYHRSLFNMVCQAANNVKVNVRVVKQPSYRNKEILENIIDTGSYNSSCGILQFTEEYYS
jgi:hypothetical protein